MSESVFDRPWVPPQIMRHYGLKEEPRMAAEFERRVNDRPDWSDFGYVVRYVIEPGSPEFTRVVFTIAAFSTRTRAEQYVRLMGGEDEGYTVEEIRP